MDSGDGMPPRVNTETKPQMDPLKDPLVIRALAYAMKHRLKRTREVTERILDRLSKRKCLIPGCEKEIVMNGNCQHHQNHFYNLIQQITVTKGADEAHRIESRILARGDRLAPGETVQFKRELRLREAEARSASAANSARVG
jgi:hypothetical protein